MKTGSFIIPFLFVICTFAQNGTPTKLKLVGSNFSYAKGNIDVEVLTEIIQQKQKEVAQRAFENIVFGNFKDAQGANKSFTTYNYVFNVLQTITKEKNKTIITRQIITNLLEYSLVNSFILEFFKFEANKNQKSYNGKIDLMFVGDLYYVQNKDDKSEKWKAYNFYLDMAYDIFLNDSLQTLQKRGLFKLLKDSPKLKEWYQQDNAYILNLKYLQSEEAQKDPKNQQRLKDVENQYKLMKSMYKDFVEKSLLGNDFSLVYAELEKTDFKQEKLSETQYNAIQRIIRLAISYLKNNSENNVIGSISEYLLDYTLVEYRIDSTKKDGILFVDAEGLISSLHEKYASAEKRSTISKKLWLITPKPFLILGVTHAGAFYEDNKLIKADNNFTDLKNIYFASEKIGIKFTYMDKKYTRSFAPGEEYKYKGGKRIWTKPLKIPLIARQELLLYGSGLLYNVANINTKQNFNYALAGISYGFTFFNDLSFNTGLSLPINSNNGVATNKKLMYNISFDIPIVEYISAIRKKRG